MATVKINDLVRRFKRLAELHPRINSFGCGKLDDLQQDVQKYPYVWLITEPSHTIGYTSENKYRSIEFTFILRVGDKKNLQTGYDGIDGIGQDNQLDILSDTFQYALDFVNTISEDSLDMFNDVDLVYDVNVDPFYNEDDANVCGNEASITLRVKNDKVCINQLTI